MICNNRFKQNILRGVSALMLSLSTSFVFSQNWVRITVEKDGIYSISYEDLREMGFSDPQKVGLVGLGGKQLPVMLQDLDLSEITIPVYHSNNRLFFFGNGPENISFINSSNSGYFKNNGRNINTDYGYYYLTDSSDYIKEIQKFDGNIQGTRVLDSGIRFIYHEEDLIHNNTDSGNIFWGEHLDGKNTSLKWPLNLNDAKNSSEANLEIVFYAMKGNGGNFSITTKGGSNASYNNVNGLTSNYSPMSIPLTSLKVNKGEEELGIDYENLQGSEGVNLDYWVLSYDSDLSSLGTYEIGITAFPTVAIGEEAVIPVNNSNDKIAIEVSNPSNPVMLTSADNKGFFIRRMDKVPLVSIFDPAQDALSIYDWTPIDHDPLAKNLRQKDYSGCELLIITPESLKECAEDLADLHKSFDGFETAIATIEEIYEEFSAGLPDPETYRRFINQCNKNSGGTLKNVIIMGPVSNNIRKIQKTAGYANVHIMPQAKAVNNDRGAYPATDYFVALNNMPDLSKLEKEPLELGIALLPFINVEDGKNYINKLKNYLIDPSHYKYLNEWLFVGGTGDEHTHDGQAVDLARIVRDVSDNSMIVSVVAVDAYGTDRAKEKALKSIGEGKGLTLYIGHAAYSMLGQKNDFIRSEDINSLNNAYPHFLIIAGCSITETDKGVRGIGEDWIIGSKNGAIGGIISERETWSGQNYDFFEEFLKNLIVASSSNNVLTIGEIFKQTKNIEENTNDLCLTLFCDPSLRIPLPVENIELSTDSPLVPGDVLKVSGTITDFEGKTDTAFNGHISIKVIEPEVTLRSEDFITSGQNGEKVLDVTYADNIVAATDVEVIKGEFNANVYIPVSLSSHEGKETRVYASAADSSSGIGAAGSVKVNINAANEQGVIAGDITPPVIEDIYFDVSDKSLYISAVDDCALNTLTGNSITIDGISSPYLNLTTQSVSEDSKKALFKSPVPQFAGGSHFIEVKVGDMNGNMASRSYEIDFSGSDGSLNLSMDSKVAEKEALFIVEGANGEVTVNIYDNNWQLVSSVKSNGNFIKWDGSDLSGNKVNSGLYKAVAVCENKSSDIRQHSKPLYVSFVR